MPPVTIQYKTYALDVILANLPMVPYEADGLLAENLIENYHADALAEAQVMETYRMAGRIKSYIHESFYVADAALMKCNVRSTYRMGGLIGYGRFADPVLVGPFVARQSLIVPEDINADDRYRLARRRN